ncbi:MAG: sulfatase-like hydrolase/transferase [Spirochaetota bacterium]
MSQSKRENIIVIVSDQLRIHALDDREIRTPHIDRLRGESFEFHTAVSNCPICMPARSALLSGQYTRRCTGNLNNHHKFDREGQWYFPDPPERRRTQLLDKTLPEYLSEAGYYNKLIGKWHIHPEPRLLGFDSWCYPLAYHRYYQQGYFEDDTAYIADEFAPELEARKMREFISGYEDERPFFLYYNLSFPHMPLGNLPEPHRSMYDPAKLTLRENVRSDDPEQLAHWIEAYLSYYFRDQHVPIPDEVRREYSSLEGITALYNGAVTLVDDMIGELVAELKKAGLYDSTTIVFTADHGDMLGSHAHYNKSQLYEEAIRVPLIVRSPRVDPGRTDAQIAQLIDVTPTLLDYLGIAAETSVDGQSLLPVLTRERATLPTNHAFVECTSNKIGVRTPEYLYGMKIDPADHSITDRELEFFSLEEDPLELRNLAGEVPAELLPVATELRSRLESWHNETPWLPNESGTGWQG